MRIFSLAYLELIILIKAVKSHLRICGLEIMRRGHMEDSNAASNWLIEAPFVDQVSFPQCHPIAGMGKIQ